MGLAASIRDRGNERPRWTAWIGRTAVVFLAAFSLVGCGSSGKKNDKDSSEGGGGSAVDEVVGYATGRTPINIGQRQKAKLIQTSIQQAVQMFEIQEGRRPRSLEELVQAGVLNKRATLDEWNKPLRLEWRDGALVVRSLKVDRATGKTVVNWEKTF